MGATEYRAQFDAVVTFSNGGGLRADEFRVDVPGPDVTEQEVASLFIASLNLLMVGSAELHNLSVFAEAHKGTRGEPADRPAGPETELPAVLARTAGSGARAVDVGALAALDVAGRAVLLHTGGDAAWGRADYATDAPYLTEAGARWLAGHGARLVGIDAVNIDDLDGGGHRPAHSILLRAGIPVVEHLTGLGQLPPAGFRFTAAPIPLVAAGTFATRAYATVPATKVEAGAAETTSDGEGAWIPSRRHR
jgi:hypothetical protein